MFVWRKLRQKETGRGCEKLEKFQKVEGIGGVACRSIVPLDPCIQPELVEAAAVFMTRHVRIFIRVKFNAEVVCYYRCTHVLRTLTFSC